MFGERLKDLRKDKNIFQKELAYDLGVTSQTISFWEVGRCYPDFEMLVKIANYFNVSTDYLLGNEKKVKENLELNEEKEVINRFLVKIGFLDNNEKLTLNQLEYIGLFIKTNKKFIKLDK